MLFEIMTFISLLFVLSLPFIFIMNLDDKMSPIFALLFTIVFIIIASRNYQFAFLN